MTLKVVASDYIAIMLRYNKRDDDYNSTSVTLWNNSLMMIKKKVSGMC